MTDSIQEDVALALHAVWTRRWIALGIAWGVALLGWLVVALIPNSYQAKGRIYVEPRAILSQQAGADPSAPQQQLDQIRQTLTGIDNLVRVVRETDLARTVRTDAEMGARIGALRANISVVSQQNNMFDITATWADTGLSDRQNAMLSAQIVAKLIDIFAQQSMTDSRADADETIRILDDQISGSAKALAASEKKRVDFEQKNVGMLPGSGSIAQRMDAVRSELGQIDSQLVGAQSALVGVNGQVAATPASMEGAGGGQGGGGALAQALGELASARSRGWTDSHPDVVALKRQIAALNAMGGGAGGGATRTPNPAYIQLRSLQAERAAAVSALQGRRAELQAMLAGMSARQIEEPGLAAEQDRLDQDYGALKTQYDRLVGDRENARLRGAVQGEGGMFTVRVIDPPGPPGAPVSPNRPLLLVGVLVAAIAMGVGTAFALGQIRPTFATAGRLERDAGLPVLGVVTQALGGIAAARRARGLRLFYGAGAGLGVMCAGLVVLEFVQRGMSA